MKIKIHKFLHENKIIELKLLTFFNKSIHIRDHIENLDFIKNKEKYGLYFQGGICKIDEKAHNYIVSCSN